MMCCLMKDADPHFKIYGTDVSTCEKTKYLGKVFRTNNTYEMVFITRYSGHLKYYKERKNHFQKDISWNLASKCLYCVFVSMVYKWGHQTQDQHTDVYIAQCLIIVSCCHLVKESNVLFGNGLACVYMLPSSG